MVGYSGSGWISEISDHLGAGWEELEHRIEGGEFPDLLDSLDYGAGCTRLQTSSNFTPSG
jgi:hypothetical protein